MAGKFADWIKGRNYDDYDDYDDMDNEGMDESEEDAEPAPRRRNRNSQPMGQDNSASLQVVVMKPEHYENVKEIANHLLARKTVLLNLERANRDTARRLVDFLAGVAFAIGGQLNRVADNNFIITPRNVDVAGDNELAEDSFSSEY
ncbi:MAG: cell division protein SepF [Clostridia bacterium]|nr:cell division protein SepF [Clostridia bacterium]